MNKWVLACISIFLASLCHARTINVLAIGNSFSQDAVEQNLYELCLDGGDTLIIGNAYIAGCPIDRHVDNLLNDKPAYSYRKIVEGEKVVSPGVRLKDIISDEDWNFISLQQSSPFSGVKSSYTYLPLLKMAVEFLTQGRQPEMIWHMTWAYAQDAKQSGFKNYGYSQSAMNDSILDAVSTIVSRQGFSRVVPTGMAIQNAREVFGDVLNSDGQHLSLVLGRYVAACTWYEILTGNSVVGNGYHPDLLTDNEAEKAQIAAHKAVEQWKQNCHKIY